MGRTPAKDRLLDTRGQARDSDARSVINARRTSHSTFSREIRMATFPQRFRQPTTIVKYNGETDPRVWLNDYRLACQLGGATSDEVIIRNLPLHLADSARTWLEHLPASQIHNWDDLVRTRAPWELLGPALLHPEARRIASGLHTMLLQALYGAPKRGAV
jgi:hypothetical protein